jgi:8-oxo-dGTP pyrophosphatase MutT (NUDIX family)
MKKFVRYLALASFLASDTESANPVSYQELTSIAEQSRQNTAQKMASGIFIMDKSGMILGCSRKDRRTEFGLPGGKLEIGDTSFMAATRETKEETGVLILEEQLAPIFVTKDGPFDFVTFVLKGGLLLERPLLIPGAGEGDCKWLTPFEFITGAFPHYNGLLLLILPDIYKDHYKNKVWYKKLEELGFDRVQTMSNEEIRSLVTEIGDQ